MFFQIPNGAKDKDGFQERVVRIKEYPICTFEHIIKTMLKRRVSHAIGFSP